MINQLEGNPLDGSMNQLYLRIITGDTINYRPMIGSNSQSDFYLSDNQLTWRGEFEAVRYQVDFRLGPSNQWFWRVNVTGTGLVDIVYGQDIGLATKEPFSQMKRMCRSILIITFGKRAKSLLFYQDKINRKMRSFQPLFKGVFKN